MRGYHDGNDGSDEDSPNGETYFHAYATKVDSVDTSEITEAERHGIITVIVSGSDNTQAEQNSKFTMNVVIQRRNCAAYNSGWKKHTVYGVDRWVQE